MLDTPCSEVVWRVLATHSIRQFPLHFPSHAWPCAITFQLDSTTKFNSTTVLFVCTVCVSCYAYNRQPSFPHTALTGLCNASKLWPLTHKVTLRFLWGACWLRTYVYNLILFLKELKRNVEITYKVQRKHRNTCTTVAATVNMPRYTQLEPRASANLI